MADLPLLADLSSPGRAALLARGRRHVRIGLGIVGTFAGALVAIGLSIPQVFPRAGVIAVAGGCVAYALALWHGSLLARSIAIVATVTFAFLALMTLAILPKAGAPLLVVTAILATIAAGFALTWATAGAQAWHHVRDRARDRRRHGRSLAEWRAAARESDDAR